LRAAGGTGRKKAGFFFEKKNQKTFAHGARRAWMRGTVVGVFAWLVAANVAAWGWAVLAFHARPMLLGSALLAYGFGLRHAVDADHIAAIDNVTRKLMQDGARPVTAGLFFSLGHSTVVVLASVAIAATAGMFRARFAMLQGVGAIAGTLVSTLFLLAVAAMNIVILRSVHGVFVRARDGAPVPEMAAGGGVLALLLRPVFRLIRRSWQMYPVGVLFGLGFDTATEVAVLGMSAVQAAHGLSVWSILVFPALFTAGMSLVDTADSVLMCGAYGWAFARPMRRLYYNMTITFVSVVVALLVGGVEALGLARAEFGLGGWFWDGIGAVNDHFGLLGYLIVTVFVLSWGVSALLYRAQGYHRLEA
jgi:high-affinity nickel-transport protein